VAVLLHLAEILAQHPPPVGVDIVLFDGEDYGREHDEAMFCIGSKYFAATIPTDYRPSFGILLDLVGDSAAVFPQEEFSIRYANDILRMVWSAATSLGIPNFRVVKHDPIFDDHVPLNTTACIRTINIIDAELVGQKAENPRRKYWHTLHDTPSQCSPLTLERVGRVLLHLLMGLRPA
ncbi:MAG: M28 family peptidase, partial [Bacteroidota bacterium]|nr:M28 family peptidase [Bacteroidota bacterium]